MSVKPKILLVDDDLNLRQLYSEVFQNENFQVFEANDGVEGLDAASRELPDIIFTGIVMPRMDGFQMMEALKKTVMTANIPVIISSHMGREEDQQKANALGAKDFIVRDMTPPIEVVKRIKSFLAKKETDYKLHVEPMSLDGPRLALDYKLKPDFSCPQCGEKLAVDLAQKEGKFEGKILCPKCGWEVK